MKIRNGFVSNSSSSSFIVIGDTIDPPDLSGKSYIIGDSGDCEFGWDVREYRGYDTLINFAYLQILCAQLEVDHNRVALRPDEWLDMLIKSIITHTGATDVSFNLTDDSRNSFMNQGYIDHQSSVCDDRNTEMFEDDDTLARFLFSNQSFIQGGNDNT